MTELSPNKRAGFSLWLCVLFLLVGFAARAHKIEALPPFNDESHHIRRAERIYTFEDRDLNLTLGKLLSYYWIGAFQPERPQAIFIGRTTSGLFALLGLAATYGVGRLLFNRRAGLLALVLAVFSPFMVFFDRLALTDPLTAALGMMVVWASVIAVRRFDRQTKDRDRWALLTGALVSLTVIAKLLGLPFVGVPLLAIMFFGQHTLPQHISLLEVQRWIKQVWRGYRRFLWRCYGLFALVMLFFIGHLLERTLTGKQIAVVNNNLVTGAAEDKSPLDIVVANAEKFWVDNWTLHSPVLWLAILLFSGVVVVRAWRVGLYLVGTVALPVGFSLLFAAELSTRYLTLGVLPMMVLAAGGVVITTEQKALIKNLLVLQAGALGLGLLWVAGFALPFLQNVWNDPTQLDLPERDRWEYYQNFTSGYGLMEAAAYAEKLPRSLPSQRVVLLGLVGSCHQMRLYLPDDEPVWLQCLTFDWINEDMSGIRAEVTRQLEAESTVFILVEPELPYVDLTKLDVKWEKIAQFNRPFDGMAIELFRIYPSES